MKKILIVKNSTSEDPGLLEEALKSGCIENKNTAP